MPVRFASDEPAIVQQPPPENVYAPYPTGNVPPHEWHQNVLPGWNYPTPTSMSSFRPEVTYLHPAPWQGVVPAVAFTPPSFVYGIQQPLQPYTPVGRFPAPQSLYSHGSSRSSRPFHPYAWHPHSYPYPCPPLGHRAVDPMDGDTWARIHRIQSSSAFHQREARARREAEEMREAQEAIARAQDAARARPATTDTQPAGGTRPTAYVPPALLSRPRREEGSREGDSDARPAPVIPMIPSTGTVHLEPQMGPNQRSRLGHLLHREQRPASVPTVVPAPRTASRREERVDDVRTLPFPDSVSPPRPPPQPPRDAAALADIIRRQQGQGSGPRAVRTGQTAERPMPDIVQPAPQPARRAAFFARWTPGPVEQSPAHTPAVTTPLPPLPPSTVNSNTGATVSVGPADPPRSASQQVAEVRARETDRSTLRPGDHEPAGQARPEPHAAPTTAPTATTDYIPRIADTPESIHDWAPRSYPPLRRLLSYLAHSELQQWIVLLPTLFDANAHDDFTHALNEHDDILPSAMLDIFLRARGYNGQLRNLGGPDNGPPQVVTNGEFHDLLDSVFTIAPFTEYFNTRAREQLHRTLDEYLTLQRDHRDPTVALEQLLRRFCDSLGLPGLFESSIEELARRHRRPSTRGARRIHAAREGRRIGALSQPGPPLRDYQRRIREPRISPSLHWCLDHRTWDSAWDISQPLVSCSRQALPTIPALPPDISAPYIKIRCMHPSHAALWGSKSIKVQPENGTVVTAKDVFLAIYKYFATPLNLTEAAYLHQRLQAGNPVNFSWNEAEVDIFRAFDRRYALTPSDVHSGLRRVDLLGSQTRYLGLEPRRIVNGIPRYTLKLDDNAAIERDADPEYWASFRDMVDRGWRSAW